MRRLRNWQVECLIAALAHYETRRHFLCQATPGAGKSRLAAELGAALFERGQIDYILCFAPSVTVAEGLAKAFSQRLGRRFDGRLAAAGGVYTYQSMSHLGAEFWALLREHRVLVVFDEIHHCAGHDGGGANAWGQQILLHVQDHARYTLALTGTAWRSDKAPIVLAPYSDPDGKIQCQYVYGIRRAVTEEVCRRPKITLVDNHQLRLTSGSDIRTFGGVPELLKDSEITYDALLRNNELIQYLLELSQQKLTELRQRIPNAGGLAVASTVEHAQQVATSLRKLGQTVVVVNHSMPGAHEVIRNFQTSCAHWIVAVGMVAEGTNIPRLQVCCYLSRIRTELHFRQVLGRIIRRQRGEDDEAWLFLLAEPDLSLYARRVGEDLPEQQTVFTQPAQGNSISLEVIDPKTNNRVLATEMPVPFEIALSSEPNMPDGVRSPLYLPEVGPYRLEWSSRFYQEVLALFEVSCSRPRALQ